MDAKNSNRLVTNNSWKAVRIKKGARKFPRSLLSTKKYPSEPETDAEVQTSAGKIHLLRTVDESNSAVGKSWKLPQKIRRRHISDWVSFVDDIENIIDAQAEIEILERRFFVLFVFVKTESLW